MDMKSVIDSTACDAFKALPLTKLWFKTSELYHSVVDVPMRELLMFRTYLGEQGFSSMFCMKAKCCAQQCMKDDLRISLSKTVPRIEGPALSRKAQPSH